MESGALPPLDPQHAETRSEDRLVRAIREAARRIPSEARTVEFGDDLASIAADSDLLWSTDMIMAGVDFKPGEHTWRAAGRKAMAVNLSDCAAMACRPVAALLCVALNDDLSEQDALEIAIGATEEAARYACPIVGGDTNSWRAPTAIAVTIAARPATKYGPIKRADAKPSDDIYLTGPVGGSILGRHMEFEPRIELAAQLAERLPIHAMIDISDGVAIDLHRLCESSGVGAAIDATALETVTHDDARRLAQQTGKPPLDHALFDGEDFELIVVIPPDQDAVAAQFPTLQKIGTIRPDRNLMLRQPDHGETPLPRRGWEHFQ